MEDVAKALNDLEEEIQAVVSEIEGVASEIQGVARKTEGVEDERRKESDPAEKAYLRQIEKRLWKQGSQLSKRDEQLRKKEGQLRDEKLKLLDRLREARAIGGKPNSSNYVPSRDQILDICSSVWDKVEARLPNMPKAANFKASHPRCRVPLCQLEKGKPSLLWQSVEQPFPASGKLRTQMELEEAKLCVVLGPSGSGKTRTLYELACSRACIFLAGCPEMKVSLEASKDLFSVQARCAQLYANNRFIPQDAVDCCVAALLVGRLYMLKRTRQLLGTDFSNLIFLFKQVEFSRLNYPTPDIWDTLVRRLLPLVNSSAIPATRVVFEEVLMELKDELNWDGIVVIDECQEVARWLVGRFENSRRNFLDKCVDSLLAFGMESYMSGTGTSLLKSSRSFSATAKMKAGSFLIFKDFEGFASLAQLKGYTEALLSDVSDFDFPRIWTLFRGRCRFYVTGLELYLMQSEHHNETPTEFMVKFAEQLTTQHSLSAFSTVRTVYADVVKFFEKFPVDTAMWRFLIDLVVAWFFLGEAFSVTITNPDLKLVEYGLGRLAIVKDDNDEFEEAGMALKHRVEVEKEEARADGGYREVEFWEPLVLKAIWHYLKTSSLELIQLQRRLFLQRASGSHEAVGKVFEFFSCHDLTGFFDNVEPAHCLPSEFYHLQPDIYRHKAHVVRPKVEGVKPFCQGLTPEYGVLEWLNDAESAADSFPVCLVCGDNSDFGPDVLFLLRSELNGTIIPVLCAMCTSGRPGNVRLCRVKESVAPDLLFYGEPRYAKQKEVVNTLRSKCRTGHLQLVVTSGLVDVSRCKGNMQQHYAPRRRSSRLHKQVDRVIGVPPLFCVIDDNTAIMTTFNDVIR